jgi:hypothetical protein
LIGVGFDIQSAEVMLPVVDLTWRGREFDSPYDGNTYEIPYEVATISTPDLFRSNTSEVSYRANHPSDRGLTNNGVRFTPQWSSSLLAELDPRV